MTEVKTQTLSLLDRLRYINKHVLGINLRNSAYIFRYNPVEMSPLVDDKILTKKILAVKNIPTPKMIGTVTSYFAIEKLLSRIGDYREFVIKPSNGFGGEGVILIQDRQDNIFEDVDGQKILLKDLENHVRDILSGVYSLSQQSDSALIEERLYPHDALKAMTYKGIPDIRILLLHGVPAMAMLRLSTEKSHGRANLHQGGIGVGINLATGVTEHALYGGDYITHHPDNGQKLVGQQLPCWQEVLEISALCYEAIPLGYMGADVVIDPQKGPMILELNLRPGLMIQMANRLGSRDILAYLDMQHPEKLGVLEKVALGVKTFQEFRQRTP